MRSAVRTCSAAVMSWLLACPGSAQTPSAAGAPADIRVRAALDRSAVWVGDRFTYTVEITCRPGVDILGDDLSRDKVKLDGLELTGVETSREVARDDAPVYRFHYGLTTSRVDLPVLTIGALPVRYYVKRPGQRLEDAAPAGEVEVPGAVIALRSVLPDGQERYDLRDGRPPQPRAAGFALAQPIGLGVIVVLLAPAAFWLAGVVRVLRRRRSRRSVRQVQQEERVSLETVKAIDLGTVDGRREAFERLNGLVRHHLRDVFQVAGPSLTPAEVGPALAERGQRVPVDVVTALLATSDLARYAPPEALPSIEACREALDQAERVLAAR